MTLRLLAALENADKQTDIDRQDSCFISIDWGLGILKGLKALTSKNNNLLLVLHLLVDVLHFFGSELQSLSTRHSEEYFQTGNEG